MFTSVVRNERAENTNNEGKGSHSEHSRTEGNRYGADHNDHQSGSGQGGQARLDTQESRQDQTERSENFHNSEEPQKPSGQRDRALHLAERQNEFYASCEQEKTRQQYLNQPQEDLHDCTSSSMSNSEAQHRHHEFVF
jgi:hypothetical protein